MGREELLFDGFLLRFSSFKYRVREISLFRVFVLLVVLVYEVMDCFSF